MRRFGVELELIGPLAARHNAQQHAADILTGLGLTARPAPYSGRNYTIWQIKSDSSLRPQDRAAEVVAPIMPASPDSYATVMRVATALDAHGYVVNRTCGVHVHINVSDLPVRTRQLIVLRFAEMQADINLGMPASRRANGYCSPLHDRAGLESAINAGSEQWRRGYGRASESVNTAFMYDSDARLEFRQAAGSCDGEKIVNWIRFLQETIDEVASRARGATFATAVRGTYAAPVRPVNPLASVPRMHHGSDNHRALMQLCNTGSVTTAWALQNQIEARVLRRIIVGFRRHGAGLRTVSTSNGPEYHLMGVAVPCTPRDLFAPAIVAPVVAPTPIVAPVPVSTVTAADFVRYDFFAGLSADIVAWVRSRRDTFAADNVA